MDDQATKQPSKPSRREFLQRGALSAVALNLTASNAEADRRGSESQPRGKAPAETMIGVPFTAMNPRIGMVGLGNRGTTLLKLLLGCDAQIVALCDLVAGKVENGRALVEKAGQKAPMLFTKGERDFEALVAREDIDMVITATSWKWHVPVAVAAMKHGKHVGIEVPAASNLKDCWTLVDTSEETRKHCVMLENCCYGYNETLVLNMAQAGLFGDLLYGEGAYLHDLRGELFASAGEGLWRRAYHATPGLNGNLYPTHGLGPVANYMGINRGDRLDYIVSMSSPQRGLEAFRKANVPAGDPRWSEHYFEGDMNTSLIKTVNGLTITLKHDVSNPHPYDRVNALGGSHGVFVDYPPRIYLDEQDKGDKTTDYPGGLPKAEWGTIESYKANFEHPLWTKLGELGRKLPGTAHGGMDFIMLFRLLQCMRNGLVPDVDVYDAATWCAPGPLSSESVAQRSAPIPFPDFTRGKWRARFGSPIGVKHVQG